MRRSLILLVSALLGVCATASQPPLAPQELRFATLTIGTQTYSNVTVTTHSKSYVFLVHSKGMLNVKVAELSDREKQALGYDINPVTTTNKMASWAKTALAKVETPQIKEIKRQITEPIQNKQMPFVVPRVTTPLIIGVITGLVALYLFGCYCCLLICKKARTEPGGLIWIPILQNIPLLRAANMSPVWFIASLLPILNTVAYIVWCVRISKACGKGLIMAILLILPVTAIFALVYLAFSDGSGKDEKAQEFVVLGTT